MFDFLKKKISNFVEKITGKVEQQPLVETPKLEEKPIVIEEKTTSVKVEHKLEEKPEKKFEETKELEKIEEKQEEKPEKKIKEELWQIAPAVQRAEQKAEQKIEQRQEVEQKQEAKQEKTFAPQLGIFKKIASVFSQDIELTEKELGDVFDDLELSLLESDASLDTSLFMVSDLRGKVVGKRVAKSKLNEFVNSTVRSVLLDVFSFSTPPTSFFSLVEHHKNSAKVPFVILFVGPNGAGKTTTVAKMAHLLKQRGVTSVISASDTFRAAAIQQAEHHGEKIGVKVVKHDYGSDPAAVAFDAVNHARSRGIDVVLIDTAGRQETNVNLIEEMKKISRVVKPDLKIFVGETLAGHSVIEQAKKFHDAIKLDGLILTKLDCDAKGGNALSIAHDLKLPIYFVGLGQAYSELVEFTPQMLVSRILAE